VIGAGQPDLLRVELALNRHFAQQALRLARGGPLEAYVRETIDVENALAALVLAERSQDLTPKDAFLPGGQHIGVADFEEAVAAGNAAAAAGRLARAFGDSPLGDAVKRGAGDPAAVDAALLRARLTQQRRRARRDPLGPAPMLTFVLGLRAQTADLHGLIWGLALGAPRSLLAGDLVTVA
jgi:vacuolar-type H+-ATPase subunit C/Vma6